MIPERSIFTVRSGVLCVLYETTLDSEPTIIARLWPIAEARIFNPEYLAELEGKPAIDARQDGKYSYRRAPFEYDDFRLVNGSRTESISTERRPAKKPKARVDVRWNYGRWQKYLKAEGWVEIPFEWD